MHQHTLHLTVINVCCCATVTKVLLKVRKINEERLCQRLNLKTSKRFPKPPVKTSTRQTGTDGNIHVHDFVLPVCILLSFVGQRQLFFTVDFKVTLYQINKYTLHQSQTAYF